MNQTKQTIKENYIYKTKHKMTEKCGVMVVTKIEMRDKEYFEGYDLPPYSDLNADIGANWELPTADVGNHWTFIEVGPKDEFPEYFL